MVSDLWPPVCGSSLSAAGIWASLGPLNAASRWAASGHLNPAFLTLGAQVPHRQHCLCLLVLSPLLLFLCLFSVLSFRECMPGSHSLTPLGWRDLWPPTVHLDLRPAEAGEASLTRADPDLVGHPCPESRESDRLSPHVGQRLEGPALFQSSVPPVSPLPWSSYLHSHPFLIWKTCPCL